MTSAEKTLKKAAAILAVLIAAMALPTTILCGRAGTGVPEEDVQKAPDVLLIYSTGTPFKMFKLPATRYGAVLDPTQERILVSVPGPGPSPAHYIVTDWDAALP